MTLYEALLRSLYAVNGADAEFLADLARPIPYVKGGNVEESGTLAVFPSSRARGLTKMIRWHEECIEDLVEGALDDDPDFYLPDEDELDDHPTETVRFFWELSDDLAELKETLASL